MKKSEALSKLEEFLLEAIDDNTIHIVEINGYKQAGLSLDFENKLLKFVEEELMMKPPEAEVLEEIGPALSHYVKKNEWEKE